MAYHYVSVHGMAKTGSETVYYFVGMRMPFSPFPHIFAATVGQCGFHGKEICPTGPMTGIVGRPSND
jgi:hypothetical protein